MSHLARRLYAGFTVVTASVAALPYIALASTCSNGSTGLCNPLKANTIQDFLTALLNFFIEIGAIIVVFMVVYVGFSFVMARGNPEKLQGARRALMWTLIGAVIILGAQAISMGIQSTVTSISSQSGVSASAP